MGRMPGLHGSRWYAVAWIAASAKDQEGSAGLLRAGHAGDGEAAGNPTSALDQIGISPALTLLD